MAKAYRYLGSIKQIFEMKSCNCHEDSPVKDGDYKQDNLFYYLMLGVLVSWVLVYLYVMKDAQFANFPFNI